MRGMKRLYLPLILFLFLVLEGVALELLPSSLINNYSLIIPHWIFVILVFITIFYDLEDTYYSILYAVIFGLLIDVVYTGVLGVYMFSYAFSIYIIHELKRLVHANFYVTMIMGILGLAIADLSIHMIFKVVGIIDIFWVDYLIYRLLPTLLANLIFLIIFYPIVKQRFIKWGSEQLSS